MALIAIDLDGTLLKEDQTVEEKTRDILQELHKDGHDIVVATGRTLGTSIHLEKLLGIKLDFITINGAYIYGKCGNILDEKPLPDELKNKFFSVMYDKDKFQDYEAMRFHAYSDFEIFINKKSTISEIYQKGLDYNLFDSRFKINEGNLEDLIKERNVKVYKFGIIDNGTADSILAQNCVSEFEDFEAVKSIKGFKDIMPKNVSKWTAIQKLCEIRNIDIKDTIVFGNEENDIEMVTKAGIGIAMADSNPLLLDVAKNVCEKTDQAGIYNFLKKYFRK